MNHIWSLLVLVGLVLAACGQQNATPPASLDIDIVARVEPELPAVGESTLIVTLKDASGAPIDGARLRVQGNMDHAGMVTINREIDQSSNGEYQIPFEWTMGGGWVVEITAQLPNNGGEASKTFEFFVEAVSSESIINRPGSQDKTPESQANTANEAVNIAYEPNDNPGMTGGGTVTITLTDAGGGPITDAVVQVVGNMAHGGMTPISGKGEHTKNGQYVLSMDWTMTGDWQVTVIVTLPHGRQFEQTFDQQVMTP